MGALAKLKFPKALALIVGVRLASVFLVQTWYVPDEYWQSLEVAHKHAFGYGHRTWEWTQGARSYLYPAVTAVLYQLLDLAGLDLPQLLIILPRVLQALLSAVADYAVYKWSGEHKWALFMICIQWFWFYTASRTLTNVAETALVALALSKYPFNPYKRENKGWICYAALSMVIRPTALIVWLPLIINNLITTREKRLRLIFLSYVPAIAAIFGLSICLDSYAHGSFVLTPWEFFSVNYFNDIGSFYGTQPWYWYLAIGFPVVLGINLAPLLFSCYETAKDRYAFRTQRLLLFVILFTLAVYSIFPHKEFRFILPLVPIATFIAQDTLSRWSRKASKLSVNLAFGALLIGNVVPSVYFSGFHQRGPLDSINILREVAQANPATSSFLFLMPCHSTPLYSHLHVNVPTRFLTCEPNLSLKPNYKDEADEFYENPNKWFQTEYVNQQVGETSKRSKLPSHIVVFDSLVPRIGNILSYYELKDQVFHSHFPEDRTGSNINIYQRAKKSQASSSKQ